MSKISLALLDQVLEYLSNKGTTMVQDMENELPYDKHQIQLAISLLKEDNYVEADKMEISLNQSVWLYVYITAKGYKFIMTSSYEKEDEKNNQVYTVNNSVLSTNQFQKTVLGLTLTVTILSTVATVIATCVSYQALHKADKPVPITIQMPQLKSTKDTVLLHTK